MPGQITAPIDAFVASAKERAKRRRRRRHAGRDRGSKLSIIASAGTESGENEEGVPFASLPDHSDWQDEDEESIEQVSYHTIAGNRFAVLDPIVPASGWTFDRKTPTTLSSDANPFDVRDPSVDLDKPQCQTVTQAENLSNHQNIITVGSNTQEENARTSSVSPPRSDFTFKYTTPTLIVTSPTPPSIYSHPTKPKRRRHRSKRLVPAKELAKDSSLNPDHPYPGNPTASEQQMGPISAIPTVSELTGKAWDVFSTPVVTSADESVSPWKACDAKADTHSDENVEAAAGSPPRPSYAAVTASRSDTFVETTVRRTPPACETTNSSTRPLQLDPSKDWPSTLAPPTTPMQPATKNRRSRFFPRSSPPTPSFRTRRSSYTFRHPRSRGLTTTVGPYIAPSSRAAGANGLLTPPPSQESSLELLSPRPMSDETSKQLTTKAAAEQCTTHTARSVSPLKIPTSPKPLRTTPWKWWRGDLSRLRSHSAATASTVQKETADLELVKPRSLEKETAKEKPEFVPALEGEWEFVEHTNLRGGSLDGEDQDGLESSGEWVWRCGEGCRCKRRGSYT